MKGAPRPSTSSSIHTSNVNKPAEGNDKDTGKSIFEDSTDKKSTEDNVEENKSAASSSINNKVNILGDTNRDMLQVRN